VIGLQYIDGPFDVGAGEEEKHDDEHRCPQESHNTLDRPS
jgi:hypothetical protein